MPFIIYDTEGEGYIILRKVVLPDNSTYYIKMATCDKKERAEELVVTLNKERSDWVYANKGAF